jgi:hypothetical protein
MLLKWSIYRFKAVVRNISCMRKTLPTRQERFDSGMGQLTNQMENLAGQLRRASAPYEQRQWMRELVDAAADILRSDTPDSQRAYHDILNNPPQGMDQSLYDAVTRITDQALSLPGNQSEKNAVINELEHMAEGILTGPAPGQGPPAGLLQKYQQAVIRRRQTER